MSHSNTSAASLLVTNLSLFSGLEIGSGVLDLACGNGRNGLALAAQGYPVTFADRDADKLAAIAGAAAFKASASKLWQVDLESGVAEPLGGKLFDAILVFNYLHRPLMTQIKQAVRAGGLVFYETFTEAQRAHGRPRNPDFLLKSGELLSYFEDWQILHSFEGELTAPARAVASVIARRPRAG